MAPPCVLLDRFVNFLDDPAHATGDDGGGREAAEAVGGRRVGEVPSLEAVREGIAASLCAMKPDARVMDPPWVTYLSMVRPAPSDPLVPRFGRSLHSGVVATVHKNLVVLYAGSRPAFSPQGWYLIYDAAASADADDDDRNNSVLSTIPGIPSSGAWRSTGRGTVVVAGADGAFVLAELLIKRQSPGAGSGSMGVLCVWSSPQDRRWVQREGRLPELLPRTLFKAHMSFSFENLLCWVDLLHGLLICDMERLQQSSDHSEVEFCFVPLPHGSIKAKRPKELSPKEFRSMGCVDGTIKLVNIDRRRPANQANKVTLTTWTLSLHNLSAPSWTQDTKLRLGDLWADETYTSRGLPQIKPIYPILDTRQHGVAYLVLVGDEPLGGNRMTKRVLKLISVDTRNKKILSSNDYNTPGRLWPTLLACEFSAYLHGSKDNQRGLEAIEANESEKRMKL